ncbi:MAG: hypothetical protein CMF46_02120 [Legionellales bacterium]|nr:hypothetical protein [Legionellales bacterium]|tara:strand:+ start:91 stop:1434 length:1344 start_codon:yes stop_codon:yes gene_type:complete
MIVLLILALTSHSYSIDLEQSVLSALDHSIDIKQQSSNILFDQKALADAKKQFDPKYRIKASAGKSESSIRVWDKDAQLSPTINLQTKYGTNLSVTQAYSYYNDEIKPLTFSLTQPLVRGLSSEINQLPITEARDNLIKSEINEQNLNNQVIIQVVEAYLKLRSAIEQNEMERLQFEEHQTEMASQIQKFESGKISQEDLTQDRIQSDQLQLHAKKGELEKAQATKAFIQLTGIYFQDGDTLEHPAITWELPGVTDAIEQSFKNNRELILDDMNVQSNSRKIKQAEDNLLPDLSFNFLHKSDLHGRHYNVTKNEISVDLSYEFNFGEKNHDLEKVTQDYQYSQLQHINKMENLASDIDYQIAAIENLTEQIRISQSGIDHEAELVKGNEISYQHGKESLSDLHKSKHQLLKKQSDLFKQSSELALSKLRLADNMGIDLLPIILGENI